MHTSGQPPGKEATLFRVTNGSNVTQLPEARVASREILGDISPIRRTRCGLVVIIPTELPLRLGVGEVVAAVVPACIDVFRLPKPDSCNKRNDASQSSATLVRWRKRSTSKIPSLTIPSERRDGRWRGCPWSLSRASTYATSRGIRLKINSIF